MAFNPVYAPAEPSRAEIDALREPTLVEFGSPWCGHCRRAQPLLEATLAAHPTIRHVKVEDGPGRPLGRSFGVKLWPTLVLMRDGHEIARLVRPTDPQLVAQALEQIAPRPTLPG